MSETTLWNRPCVTCGRVDCTGAPRFKGVCNYHLAASRDLPRRDDLLARYRSSPVDEWKDVAAGWREMYREARAEIARLQARLDAMMGGGG